MSLSLSFAPVFASLPVVLFEDVSPELAPLGGDLSGFGLVGWLFGELLVGELLVGVLVAGLSAGVALASPGAASAATMANARSFMTVPLVKSAVGLCKWGTVRRDSDSGRLSPAPRAHPGGVDGACRHVAR